MLLKGNLFCLVFPSGRRISFCLFWPCLRLSYSSFCLQSSSVVCGVAGHVRKRSLWKWYSVKLNTGLKVIQISKNSLTHLDGLQKKLQRNQPSSRSSFSLPSSLPI